MSGGFLEGVLDFWCFGNVRRVLGLSGGSLESIRKVSGKYKEGVWKV